MKRDTGLFIEDILSSISNIEIFTRGVNKEKFMKDGLIQNAVIRQLEIIGEAVKNVPQSFREKYPKISWQGIAGLRDVLSHSYFGVNLERIWEIVKKDLSELKEEMAKIKEAL